MPKQRSKKQRVQAAFNVTKLHAIDALVMEDDVDKLKQGIKKDGTRLTVEGIRLQLSWHRRHDTAVPSKSEVNKLKKEGIFELLIAAVERRIANGGNFARITSTVIDEVDEDWEEQEQRDEADLMEIDQSC
ncbi:hypothetical protein CPB84DRAFT_1747602 [Gymnopilus junonius]|uniref:Uncharacterized protein n=1 Tax=Gymnopilus junonius TaxID=109634 RepID=A0A9P5NKD2_GYMJU|nr:hypothetical protein CPB84DRAFT_1747602 [Gymnopilus junonius]